MNRLRSLIERILLIRWWGCVAGSSGLDTRRPAPADDSAEALVERLGAAHVELRLALNQVEGLGGLQLALDSVRSPVRTLPSREGRLRARVARQLRRLSRPDTVSV